MQYVQTELTSKKLSRLVYGTNGKMTGPDPQAASEVLDMAWEAGFRVIDTANAYGNSEKNIGKWIASRPVRDELVLLDKGCNPGQEGSPDVMSGQLIREQMERSLDLLQTDHVELYILHRDDPSVPVGEVIETFNALKEEGKVERFGGSNWTMGRIQEANAYAASHGLEGFSLCGPSFNPAAVVEDPWGGSVSAIGPKNRAFFDWLVKTQFPVFAYSSLGRGFFSGSYRTDGGKPIEACIGEGSILEYNCPQNIRILKKIEELADAKGCAVSQVTLAWEFRQGLNLFPLVNATSAEHMKDLTGVFDIDLTEEECAQISALQV